MTGFHDVLDPGEEVIARARIRGRQLGERLVTTMIDRELCGELQRFLDEQAYQACDAMDRLGERPAAQLRHRLDLVLGLVWQDEDRD